MTVWLLEGIEEGLILDWFGRLKDNFVVFLELGVR